MVSVVPPVIILVKPQLGENIGMCARAMLNCGVTELRLVSPRDGWPNEKAISASSGADELITSAKLYESTRDAVADLQFVLASTARGRDIAKPVLDTHEASRKIRTQSSNGHKCGVLFGAERTGLENDDLIFADAILNIPLNPEFSSLNIAQAVLLVCFSWLMTENKFQAQEKIIEPAPKETLQVFLDKLENGLDNTGFFKTPEQKPVTWRNIQNFFYRASPTAAEISTLHGILSSLINRK